MGEEQLESVDVCVDGVEHVHQFRVRKESAAMFVVMGRNCKVLQRLRVGETINLTYHTKDVFRPTRSIPTRIHHITEEQDGPFKGHCLVGLSFAEAC